MIPNDHIVIKCVMAAGAVMATTHSAISQEDYHQQTKCWAIKEVLLPYPIAPGENVYFGPPRFLGDTDGDGLVEALFRWNSFSSTGGLGWRQQVFDARSLLKEGRDNYAPISNWFYNRTVKLNTPIGSYLTAGVQLSLETGVYSIQDGQFATYLPIPPPAHTLELLMRAGDLNQDGWDDLFAYPYDGQLALNVGLIDGKTRTFVWNDYDPSVTAWSAYPVLSYIPQGPPDLDGDQIADFTVSYAMPWAGGSSPFRMFFRAYSGLSGSRLWERTLLNDDNAGFFSNLNSDLNGDGVIDLSVMEPNNYDFANGTMVDGQLSAINGSTGNTIWEVPIKYIDPKWASGISINDYYIPYHPVFPTPDMNGDGVDEVSFTAHNFVITDPKTRRVIASFSGKDGAFLGLERMPETAYPWLSEPVDDIRDSRRLTPLGDFDNDGWQEMALGVNAPEFDQNGGTTTPLALAILSHPSLIADTKTHLGGKVSFAIHVPNSAGKHYQVIASTRFSPRSGIFLDGWNTHLDHSGTLTHFLTHRPIRGDLDSMGKANGSIPVPMIPGFSGKTLFFKVAITDQANPDQILCLSNLCWTKIL